MAERDRVETADRADEADPHEVAHEDPHGHSIAAWVCVGTVMLGSLVMSVAVVAALVWMFVVGAVVVLVGMVLGKVLHGMGFGEPAQEAPPHPSKPGVR
ncbi:MAG TPA: HGxxPAAW family protein [Actinomycetales bacterium]|nr:HGxxPAAW family protein [Actinomycetales bacterium]